MLKKIMTPVLVACMALSVSGCSNKQAVDPTPVAAALPQDWYRLPEDGGKLTALASEPSPGAVESFDATLDAQSDALEEAAAEELAMAEADRLTADSAASPFMASDIVPWRLVAFMTDLSVSTTGILASLTAKGTPSFSLYWRKKLAAQRGISVERDAPADVTISADTPMDQINAQIDTAVRAALASGRIKDEKCLREGMTRTITSFRELTRDLDTATAGVGDQWWASRIRFDVSVSASGRVAFFTGIGTDVRMRFEWHRIKHPHAVRAPTPLATDPKVAEGRRTLGDLVTAISSDLYVLSRKGSDVNHGLQPYSFRVGVGMTAGGTFGVVKGNASAMGHVYFSRDVPKPSVRPTTIAVRETELSDDDIAAGPEGTVNFIEDHPSAEHLAYAWDQGIVTYAADDRAADDRTPVERVLYRINRSQLRRGLYKAERMANFFVRRARRVRTGHWGIHEIRTGFDMSVTGTFGIATAGGLAAAEIAIYNEEF